MIGNNLSALWWIVKLVYPYSGIDNDKKEKNY